MQNKTIKVLLIGDIVGKVGRRVLKTYYDNIIEKYQIDFCVANCENAAGGFGLNKKTSEELFGLGIDVLTSGNHIWDKKDIFTLISSERRILRPANYAPGVPGHGSGIYSINSSLEIGVLNLSGRIFVDYVDCPFRIAAQEVERLSDKTKIIIVDIHGEATSEKIALGYYLDGLVSAVVGTHTHVQTADEKILSRGTAYISDAGMTGPSDSVIGIDKNMAISRFITKLPKRFEMARGNGQLNAVVIEINTISGLAKKITRIQLADTEK